MNRYLLILVGIFVSYEIVVLILAWLIGLMRKSRNVEYMMIAVRVSKENEAGPIVAEQIFASIHGVYRNISWHKKLRGYRNDKISFEIANLEDSIRFFIRFPKRVRNMIEGQIYAQYPDVEIEEVDDFAQKKSIEVLESAEEQSLALAVNNKSYSSSFTEVDLYENAVGCELEFGSPDIYPIKRYAQFEDKLTRVAVDPLSSITATLSRLNQDGDEAWLQIVVSPLSDRWRIILLRCIKIVKGGFLGTWSSCYINNYIWLGSVEFARGYSGISSGRFLNGAYK